jgi:hypothetical protein
MGYYTSYSLGVKGIGLNESRMIIEDLRNTNDNADFAITEFGETLNGCKWYGHEKEMREFSKEYPDVVFELHGEGEGSGDLWNKYFRNGKCQLCSAVIVFPEYDPRKLC